MIKAYLNGVELPELEQQFLRQPIEIGEDVEVASGDIYTDFVALKTGWELNWETLTEDQYNAVYAIYQTQFDDRAYPTLSIPYYGVEDVPVRMTINDKDIWKHCGDVQGVRVNLRETAQLEESS